MSRGQVRVDEGARVVARALGDIDAQLVADVTDTLGHTPAYEDVMYAGRRWGTDTTGTLLRILEDAYPPPPAGWGLTQTTTTHNGATTGVAHNRKGKSCRR